ncbi:hypothetical protein UFOVP103_20 [uncultured Caudovirales phage]|uniref:Helix-turn-helix domain containing protein n=1 Tax=uncultured Caudovirales phage TaxID=2100421 RepID=A0A6J7WLI4_9CAUD|nr:hypothetical protein UFOVP103_20 [uncultured Caudovirales phage]CAB5217000.1 hypothetical protein UFOVP197_35 [uncultured Caudovirales phage]
MKEQTDYPLILSVPQIAEIMQCSEYLARNLMTTKGFPLVRMGVGGKIKRVGRDSFFKWLQFYQDQQMQQFEVQSW